MRPGRRSPQGACQAREPLHLQAARLRGSSIPRGAGEQVLRVREVLERYPGIKSFRYGRPEEGEFGVTVVELE